MPKVYLNQNFYSTAFKKILINLKTLLTHFVLQTRISRFQHNVASARKREALVLDQYFCFGVPSLEVTAPS